MKVIYAIIRPEKAVFLNKELEKEGYTGFTKWGVSGRGRQKGIQVGEVVYEEMSKTMFMTVVDDDDKNHVIDLIMENCMTGEEGSPGDGRIFVTNIEESYTISKQSKE